MACSKSDWRSSCHSAVERAVASSSAGGVAAVAPEELLAGVDVEADGDAMRWKEKERKGDYMGRGKGVPGKRG